MNEYHVSARRYRPQTFGEILCQEAIVTTLKNAITGGKLAHAYLFCGSRGTGKTTLARVFAKALNCTAPRDADPCNSCSSCRQITAGSSLDILEIDGASNRGIDDVRQINETVAYASAAGKYKIYIIDEVHMLTKEAFNALLKTLEEPPPKVIFFFATTEPHKVLPTILSRCQRFNLNRISIEQIVAKLAMIASQQGRAVDDEALRTVAMRADGSLRDAESLFDQIISFCEGVISVDVVAEVLGIVSKEVFFSLDGAAAEGNLAFAFEVVEQLFSQGKDLQHFIEQYAEHFRALLAAKLCGGDSTILKVSPHERVKYERAAQLYTQEQCFSAIELLIEAQSQMRYMPSPRIALESLLLRILRIKQRISIDFLVRRLSELEQAIGQQPIVAVAEMPSIQAQVAERSISGEATTVAPSATEPQQGAVVDVEPASYSSAGAVATNNPLSSLPAEHPTAEDKTVEAKRQCRYDTLLNFAAVELEGSIDKKVKQRG